MNKIIQEADWPSRFAFYFFSNIKPLYFTYSHSNSFVLSSLSFAVTHCHFLLLLVIRCHMLYQSLSHVVTRCITRCHSLYHSMPFVVSRCHSLYHSFSFVVTRCHSMSLDVTTRLSFYKRSLFYNFLFFTSFIIKTKTKKFYFKVLKW